MLNILLIVPGIVVLAVGVVLMLASMKPSRAHYERSAIVNAPPEVVHGLIDDFYAWAPWSPWEKLDPNIRRMYGSPAAGIGGTYAWVGNKNVGEGRMTIVESKPGALVRIRLEFIKPFAAINEAKFVLTPMDGGTKVTWMMDCPNLFVGKVMSLFMDMDRMIGDNFEKGLADMGAVAQSRLNSPSV